MSSRRIHPIEQHVEKIVLGVAALGFAGVIGWQFAGGERQVKVGSKEVPVSQAMTEIAGSAQRIQGQIRETNPSTPELPKVDALAQFKAGQTRPVAPAPQLAFAPAGIAFKGIAGSDTGLGAGDFVAVPTLPAPGNPVAVAFMSTIAADEVAATPELARLLPSAAPFDKAAVSVEVTLDSKQLMTALASDADGNGPGKAMQRNWWENTQVLAVEVQREEQLADGSWGNKTTLPPLPGRLSLLGQLQQAGLTSEQLAEIVEIASTREEEIQRPMWYRQADLAGFAMGEPWKAPSEQLADLEPGQEGAELTRLRRQEAELVRQEANQVRQLERLRSGGGGGGSAPAPGGPGGGRRPGAGGGGGGGGGGGAPGGGQPTETPQERQIKALERQLTTTRTTLADVRTRLAAMGGQAATPVAPPVRDAALSSILAQDQVKLWAHDLTAERGKTYRYNVQLRMNNPLFNRPGQLAEADRSIASQPTIATPPSAWSSPVMVDREVYAFVISTQPAQAGVRSVGAATVELFTYSYGYWRQGQVSVEPGDVLAGRVAVIDVDKLQQGPGAAPANPNNPAPAPANPRRPGGGLVPDAPAPGAPPAAPGAPAAALPAIPMKDRMVMADAIMLDVLAAQGAEAAARRQVFGALVREAGGVLQLRVPEAERRSPLYTRLLASAEAGKRAMKSSQPAGSPAAPAAPTPGGDGPRAPVPAGN